MEQRNEPTTAEIVPQIQGRLRELVKSYNDQGLHVIHCSDALLLSFADRLEQLERENAKLTARAEQAERERDAAVEMRNNAMRGEKS